MGSLRAIRALIGGVALAALASCNILGPATYFAFGQPKAPAQYELIDRPTVLFVDDRYNMIPMNASRIRREIADKISAALMDKELVTNIVSSRDAMSLARGRDREGNLMSVEAIGEAVGAEQVIYIEMLSFRGSSDGYSPRPEATVRLKVIDVPQRSRLFPDPNADAIWHEVSIVSPPISPDLYRTNVGKRQIETIITALLADQIAKVFYEHVPDELGTRLNPQ